MASKKSNIPPEYYTNIIWAIIKDMTFHFGNFMELDNFAL